MQEMKDLNPGVNVDRLKGEKHTRHVIPTPDPSPIFIGIVQALSALSEAITLGSPTPYISALKALVCMFGRLLDTRWANVHSCEGKGLNQLGVLGWILFLVTASDLLDLGSSAPHPLTHAVSPHEISISYTVTTWG